MSMLWAKICPKGYSRGDNRYLSEPFKFIGLPLYCALLFILYWFIYCPLMFVKVYLGFNHVWPPLWPVYFWVVALAVFLILVAILVILWKSSPKNDDSLHEVDPIEESLISVNKNPFSKPSGIDEYHEETEMKPKTKKIDCNEEIKTKPKVLKLTNLQAKTETISDHESPPLSPREIFFHDLIESANKSCFNSSTKMLTAPAGRKSAGEENQEEYFIANVSPTKTCVSNIFMFVNPEEAKEELNATIVKEACIK